MNKIDPRSNILTAFTPSYLRDSALAAGGAWRLGFCIAVALMPLGASAMDSRPAGVAGRYAILRAENKDTGCMLTLDTQARAEGFKAQLAPACRDNGMVIFDPIAWSLERGRLALTARKGHKTHFERQPDGIWRRDVKEGKELSLKPL